MPNQDQSDKETRRELLAAIGQLRDRAIELGQARLARTLERALGQVTAAPGEVKPSAEVDAPEALRIAIGYLRDEAARLGEAEMARALEQCLALDG
ncbi:hypothetical protein [Telmatospirillum sp.]|uniref:hypothetical protein n=1 Tax=Telmatospirillum sp. TaxID=2079197 RepID=UPI00284DBB51|nr:hypothetical protein [Telmatospirillum sp.]MDR3439688.1 hypothetical protein [Telmatospirillum sp.]